MSLSGEAHALGGLYGLASIGLVVGASRTEWFPIFVASACVMLALQFRMWHTNGLTWTEIVVLAVLVRLVAIPVPPVLSDDAFRYLWDGTLILNSINPFVSVPSDPGLVEFHASELYPLINRPDVHTVYPPVSQAVFALAATIGGDSWMKGFIALKALSVLLEMTGLYLLSRIVERRTIMLLALSPVLIVAGAVQGHTDILLVCFLGIALWSWRLQYLLFTIVLLTLAGWVKLWPLLFVITFLLHLAIRDKRLAFQGLLVSAGVSIVVWLPFMHPAVPGNLLESLNLYVRWFEFNAGPYFLVKEWYWWTTGMDWSKQIGPAFRLVFLGGTLLIWLLQVVSPGRLKFVLSSSRDQPWMLCWAIACGYFLLSTTIHPWYIVGLVVMGIVLFEQRIPWHILLFSVLSFGTYLLYVDGPYWWTVAIAWSSGFAVWAWLQASGRRTGFMDIVLQWRAWTKMQMMRPWISSPGLRGGAGQELRTEEREFLDLGGAEGYVAAAVAELYPGWRKATIADVREAGRTSHEYVMYDGLVLPVEDKYYELVILSYVLHHSSHPDRVLSEALRVCSGRVVILESVYRTGWGKQWLLMADQLANTLRSRGAMKTNKAHLHHRREEDWVATAERLGAKIIGQRSIVRPGHRTAILVLEPGR